MSPDFAPFRFDRRSVIIEKGQSRPRGRGPSRCEDPVPGADSDQGQPLPPTDLLQSWKEIAAYLDATERSAQRWEQLEGLPVHRQIRNKRSAVYAYKSEIEQWRRSRSTPPAATLDEDAPGVADGEAPAPLTLALAGACCRRVGPCWVGVALLDRRRAPCSAAGCGDRSHAGD